MLTIGSAYQRGAELGDKDPRDSRTIQGAMLAVLGAIAQVIWVALGDPTSLTVVIERMFDAAGPVAMLASLVGIYIAKVGDRAATGRLIVEHRALRATLEAGRSGSGSTPPAPSSD